MRRVAVFGGTGFLGRRIVGALLRHNLAVRAVARRPGHGAAPGAEAMRADIEDAAATAAALAGCDGAVNAVGLYVEARGRTFASIHVDGAARLARLAREAGLSALVHVSGIGADPRSPSPYIASRGEGERAVRDAFPAATILRPAVLFGPGDAFLAALAALIRRAPVFPLFGRGETRLQPVHVDDVAEAAAIHLARGGGGATFELGGPEVLAYRDVIRKIGSGLRRNPVLLPVPFALWQAAARVAELLPEPPITRDQVALMRLDTVASPALPGLAALGIAPRSIDDVLPEILRAIQA